MDRFSEEQLRRYSERAAEILEAPTTQWVRGSWLVDVTDVELNARKEVGEDDSDLPSLGSAEKMSTIRSWLKNVGFGTRNRTCGMCAQGALLVALAEDESIPDDLQGYSLLTQFDALAERTAFDAQLGLNDDGDFNGIPDANDSVFDDEDQVTYFLRQMAQG